jgi:hypothetical protein
MGEYDNIIGAALAVGVVVLVWLTLASRGIYIIPPFIIFRGRWRYSDAAWRLLTWKRRKGG